jgi:hypothetical protein
VHLWTGNIVRPVEGDPWKGVYGWPSGIRSRKGKRARGETET